MTEETRKRHFTRKHYYTIAQAIRARVIAAPEDQDALLGFAKQLGDAFKAEYPLFEAPRFLKLCGLID